MQTFAPLQSAEFIKASAQIKSKDRLMKNIYDAIFPRHKFLFVFIFTFAFALLVQVYLFLANWAIAGHPFLRPNMRFNTTNVINFVFVSPLIETVVMFAILWIVRKASISTIFFVIINALIAFLFHEGLGKFSSALGFILISLLILENKKSFNLSVNFWVTCAVHAFYNLICLIITNPVYFFLLKIVKDNFLRS
jgi:hypothetical protein